MKKIFLIAFLSVSISIFSQRNKYNNILESKSIPEIENFLKEAHPDDPRRIVLKPKLIALKNSEWTKGAKNAKPMQARPIIVTEIPKTVIQKKEGSEAEEYKNLLIENSKSQQEKMVRTLNKMFETDEKAHESLLLVQNNSECNMIMRINGDSFYNLAVPAHGENTIILLNGNYELKCDVCGIKYNSIKSIQKSMMVILNKPAMDFAEKN